jgi:biotin synthase-like enzyme
MDIENRAIKREIDVGLGTIGRIKIMAELAKKPNESFTKYALLKGTGLKRSDLKENLAHLVAINWVKEYKSVYPKYQINLDNPRVQLLSDFLKKSGYI